MARLTLLFCLVTLALLSFFEGALAKPTSNNCPGKDVGKRSAQEVIKKLDLAPNPEKGWWKETFRDEYMITTGNGTRSASTAIFYLLEGSAGKSAWHRIDAVEIWHYYAGAPLTLYLSHNEGKGVREVVLGPDVFKGQQPHVVIHSWEWQRCKSLGDWTLVGNTGKISPRSMAPQSSTLGLDVDILPIVAPAFDPAFYEFGADNWNPK